MSRRRIAFLTSGDPTSKCSWSGIDYYMSQALQKHCGDLYHPGSIEPKFRVMAGKILNKISLALVKKRYAYLHSFLLARGYAQAIKRQLAGQPLDLIFVPSSSTVAAFLETNVPITYLSGTTFALMKSYYPQFSQLLPLSIEQGNAIEQMMVDKAQLLLYPTEWPVKSCMEDYHAEPSKIHIIPYGANIDEEDIPSRDIVLSKRRSNRCRLLFLGVDWNRKGGPIAFDTLVQLEAMGVEAELTVCGCVPPSEYRHGRMVIIPFLNKNDPMQRRELSSLFLNSDFLLVPTRGECFGVVFCEAGAFGLPSITTDTGGVTGVVRDGENGYLLPLEAQGADYARVIRDIYHDEQRYSELVKSSRAAFEDRLNWDAWGMAVKRLIEETI